MFSLFFGVSSGYTVPFGCLSCSQVNNSSGCHKVKNALCLTVYCMEAPQVGSLMVSRIESRKGRMFTHLGLKHALHSSVAE